MCGIIGAIAQRNVVSILLQGLQRLEYRGYDSAGLVVVENNELQRIRSIGRVAELTTRSAATSGHIGIAHRDITVTIRDVKKITVHLYTILTDGHLQLFEARNLYP